MGRTTERRYGRTLLYAEAVVDQQFTLASVVDIASLTGTFDPGGLAYELEVYIGMLHGVTAGGWGLGITDGADAAITPAPNMVTPIFVADPGFGFAAGSYVQGPHYIKQFPAASGAITRKARGYVTASTDISIIPSISGVPSFLRVREVIPV